MIRTLICLLALTSVAFAGGHEGEPLHDWFNNLASKKGLCCSFVDGFAVKDVDWDTFEGHYRVRIDRQWVTVPEEAVVAEPNRYGQAVVWPYKGSDGETLIRCFMPSTMS